MDKKRKRSTKNPFSSFSRWWENSSAEIHSLDCGSPSDLIEEQREREREDLVCFVWKNWLISILKTDEIEKLTLFDRLIVGILNSKDPTFSRGFLGKMRSLFSGIALGRYLNPDETGNFDCRWPVCPRYQRQSELHRLFDGNQREESQWESLF